MSIGVISCQDPVPDLVDEIIHRADTLMYAAKNLGKNRYVLGLFAEVNGTNTANYECRMSNVEL